jgi:hypothetical protein
MAFVLLKDEDGQDFICHSANIASITAGASDVVIEVHKGATVKTDRSLQSHLQQQFRISAERKTPESAALQLAGEIAAADRDGKNLDLRHRAPPTLTKNPYDPGYGW